MTFSRRVRAALLLALSLWTSACFAYQDVGRLPEAGDLPNDLRIYRYDGTIIDLAGSRIAADTIRGFRPRSSTPILVPLAHVDSLQTRQLQKRPSIIIGTVAVVVLAVVLSSHLTSLAGPITPDAP